MDANTETYVFVVIGAVLLYVFCGNLYDAVALDRSNTALRNSKSEMIDG